MIAANRKTLAENDEKMIIFSAITGGGIHCFE